MAARIDRIFGADVSLDYTDGVRVVLTWRLGEADQKAIRGLGDVLGGFARVAREGDQGRAEILYTDDLDRRIVALVDLLVAVRYGHPRMIQLPLQLTEDEEQELAEVMGG